MKMGVAKLFLVGAAGLGLLGFVTGLVFGNSSLDIHLHDTYVVLAHFHIVAAVALLFLACAGVYYVFPILFKRRMNRNAGLVHFWITFLGTISIFWPMHYEGVAGMPRRYYDYSAWENFKMYGNLNSAISIVVILVFLSQFIFALNFAISIFAGQKVLK